MRTRQNGFSLVEALVAILVLLLVTASVASMMQLSFATAASNVGRGHAVALAEGELEDLRSQAYEKLASRIRTESRDGILYTVTTSVTRETPEPNMATIAVAVSWKDKGNIRQYATHTIYTKLGG